ncbi:TPA: hypothetical protein NNA44_004398 [Escherichia coli]|nr:hypothetical protein [Escherichia coli]HAV9253352.1 hypothetical protein [Escherichia coli]HAW0316577.1 hypothetical protein [Escherichia coli]HAW1122968.1 hypothetical protein [Escherichia coli]HCH7642722.1 hypothetical protein [Escherichia coli]
MHNPVFAQRLRVLGSAAFFSLVTAPALALFVVFIGLSFNASLSGYFLQAAHELVDGAPPGTVYVQVCEPPTALDGGEVQALAEAYRPRCHDIPQDERAWQRDTDHSLRTLYLLTSLLGLGVWLALNPVSCIWRSLFRRTSS